MADGFWESEDIMTEKEAEEIFAQTETQQEDQAQKGMHEQLVQETEEQAYKEFEEEQEADDLQVLKDASLRLEQGNLYKMLLKHNLFEEVDADPRAIQNVQREIRTFIRERLEVLVGLKEDPKLKKTQPVQQLSGGIFDQDEILVLKEFLSKVVKKNSNSIAPVRSEKQLKINPLKQHSKPVADSLVRVNTAKQKNIKTAQKIQAKEPARKPLTKSPSEMTIQELIEHNRQTSYKRAESKNKLPMPDDKQTYLHYAARQTKPDSFGHLNTLMKAMGKSVGLLEVVDSTGEEGGNDGRI